MDRREPFRPVLLSAACAVFFAVLAEGALRAALFTDVLPRALTAPLREPARYAEPDTDDFWKLRCLWGRSWQAGAFHHPQLGATTPRTAENPLGVAGAARPLPRPDSTERIVLFYGSSYLTYPLAPLSARIPQLLEARLKTIPVWNFGMWSYGLDQTVLRFELTRAYFPHPTVLIGINTDDIDRCILSVREGQKPRFVIEGSGELRLTNVPIEPDEAAYLRRNPPQVRSYVMRIIRTALGRTRLGQRLFVRQDHRKEMEALAAALLERAVNLARANGIPVAFLIFYPRFELERPSWRAAFLRETFDRLGVPYLDTEIPLRQPLGTGEAGLGDLYDEKHHHTPRANALIVEGILRAWPDLRIPQGPPGEERRACQPRSGRPPTTGGARPQGTPPSTLRIAPVV
jgi:hypothetical protein